MTKNAVTVLEDGTRVYKGGARYTPVPRDERKNLVRRPDDPGAVRWGNTWLLPLDLLGEDQRQLPETRPDTIAFDHAAIGLVGEGGLGEAGNGEGVDEPCDGREHEDHHGS